MGKKAGWYQDSTEATKQILFLSNHKVKCKKDKPAFNRSNKRRRTFLSKKQGSTWKAENTILKRIILFRNRDIER